VTADLRICEVHIFEGEEAVLPITETVEEIAERRRIREVGFDPWRYEARLCAWNATTVDDGPVPAEPRPHDRRI